MIKSLIDILAISILAGIYIIIWKLVLIIDLLEQSFVLGLK